MEFIGRYECDGLKMGAYRNELGQAEVIFDTIDKGYSMGILHVSHEMNLVYNVDTDTWSGDEIATEWFDYDEEEAREKAEALGLPPVVRKCLAALGIAR